MAFSLFQLYIKVGLYCVTIDFERGTSNEIGNRENFNLNPILNKQILL